MIAEISSLVSSAKAAYDIAKGIHLLQTDVERNENISKILEVLVSVQFQASSVLAHAHELEIEKHNLTQKIMEFKKWSETELQYELKEVDVGTFVYSYKKTDNNPKPAHWLCPKCFQEKKTYILQLNCDDEYCSDYICSNCNTSLNISKKTKRSHGGTPSPSSWT